MPWRKERLPTPVFMGFPGGSDCKDACNSENLGSVFRLGRSPGEGSGNPLPYSCLVNFHGLSSLMGYSPWSRKESDTAEQLSAIVGHSAGARPAWWCRNTHTGTVVRIIIFLFLTIDSKDQKLLYFKVKCP